jgi:hypothetical protein
MNGVRMRARGFISCRPTIRGPGRCVSSVLGCLTSDGWGDKSLYDVDLLGPVTQPTRSVLPFSIAPIGIALFGAMEAARTNTSPSPGSVFAQGSYDEGRPGTLDWQGDLVNSSFTGKLKAQGFEHNDLRTETCR